jgi:(E)-4-hydroxy-3-methylbut-2-enyl-diphosphate synthase
MGSKRRQVRIGRVVIGGDNPVLVQSMTKTHTKDIQATLAQIRRLQAAGCEMVRVAIMDLKDASAIPHIKKDIQIPLIADIHFDYNLALAAIDQGVDKVRINPGTIGSKDKVARVVRKAKDKGIPIRIGINSGSLQKDILKKYGHPSAEAMLESLLNYIEFFEGLGFYDIVVSAKATDVSTTVQSYRLIAERCDYPLHLGVTEAGLPGYGTIKSAIGIGTLLLEGIGDTIRVSLTGDPVKEVVAGYDILKATGRRVNSPELITCPQCGRIQIDLERLAREVDQRIKGLRLPIRVAILGCGVNGPGEAAGADIGIAGGKREGLLFSKGKIVKKVKQDRLVEALMEEINRLYGEV